MLLLGSILGAGGCGDAQAGDSGGSASETLGTESSTTTDSGSGTDESESGGIVGECLGCDCDEVCSEPWTCVAGHCSSPGFAYVPAGEFEMGCRADDERCEMEEQPAHTVSVSAFELALTETTVDEYAACVTDGSCDEPAEVHDVNGVDFYNYGNPERGDHPVNGVTWEQAGVYCAHLGGRLPTEAEWEYAARGEDLRLYPWGDEPLPTCEVAQVYDCPGDSTEPVMGHPTDSSPFGVMGMAGNVAEFVADWYSATYYESSESQDPKGPDTGIERVYRGTASYVALPEDNARTSARGSADPMVGSDRRGFRCALDVD